MRCRVCFETVETYRPTGTNVLRAEQHPVWPGYHQYDCPGSFGPVDDEVTVERDAERTRRWKTDGGPSLREFLESKDEL